MYNKLNQGVYLIMNKTVSIYLDVDFYKELSEIAKEEERSINYIVNKALKKFVEERKKNANS